MSMHKFAVILLGAAAGAVALAESPGLGVPVDAETLARVDYTILPNGDGLPDGSGTAKKGAAVYQQHCIACHGEGGAGSVNDALVGGHGSLATGQPKKTVGSYWPYATTVFDYVRRAMPLQSPGSLSSDEVYSVTAYILFLNDIVLEIDELNAETLPRVEMPNRDGFVWDYSP